MILCDGKRIDKTTGDPLPGATVKIKGTSVGTATNMEGKFELTVADNFIALEVSFIGYGTVEVTVGKREQLEVLLEAESSKMDEVVVTGVYTRKKESFTGSSQTYKAEELKSVGNQNLIQSLKVLDPAFAVLESNEFGSDPNRLPDLEIRGKSSIVGLKEQFGEDPNQPLFILDGFETTLRTIMDLSMDRIASVTILKDAASTAIYGAKAANGVVVVETKVPQGGRLRLSYNGSFEISFADLTDYNLMNAAEKLEFERLAGNFKSNIADNQELKEVRYNKLLGNVLRGVDTYWLSEPIRTGFNQRHNLYVEGGNEQFRYGFGGSYNKIQGVMKSSTRDIFSGNLDLLYRVGKLTFSNKLSVDVTKHDNPVVPFSEMKAQKAPITSEQEAAKKMAFATVERMVTRERVEKELYKMRDEGILPEEFGTAEWKLIAPVIAKRIYADCVKEEAEAVEACGKLFGKMCGGQNDT